MDYECIYENCLEVSYDYYQYLKEEILTKKDISTSVCLAIRRNGKLLPLPTEDPIFMSARIIDRLMKAVAEKLNWTESKIRSLINSNKIEIVDEKQVKSS